MLKRIVSVVTLLLMTSVLLPLVGSFAQEEETACTVTANYDEAMQENNTNALRLFAYLGDDGLFDGEPDTISLYFAMLQSSRQYYEVQAHELPDCAQELNTAYIRALTSMQDVLAYNWAILANPDRATYFIGRANNAKELLNEAWGAYSDIQQSTEFVIEG